MSRDRRTGILPQFRPLRHAIDDVHACVQDLEAASGIPVDTAFSVSDVAVDSAARLASYDVLVADCQTNLTNLLRLRADTAAMRNATLPPISLLPPEILRDVFLDVVIMGHWAGRRQGRRRASVVISHTCSLWRAIALDHPALWSYINLWQTSQRLTKLFAERCEGLPLKITGFDSDEQYVRSDVSFYALTELLDRTTDLSVLASDQLSAWFFSEPVDFEPCSDLESFSLQYRCADDHGGSSEPRERILYRNLFGGEDLPNLRHLSLIGYRFPWEQGRYAGLRSLRIDDVPLAATSRKDKDFSWVIRESPLLECLELGSWGKGEQETLRPRQLRALNPDHAGQISLPFLHTIKFHMHISLARWLLSLVDAPSLEVFHVQPFGAPDQMLGIGDLLTLHPGLDVSKVLASLHKIEIGVLVERQKADIRLSGYSGLDEMTLCLRWSENGLAMNSLSAVLQAMQSHEELSQVQTLALGSYLDEFTLMCHTPDFSTPILQPEWPALPLIVRKLPSVTSLALHGGAHLCVTADRHYDSIMGSTERLPAIDKLAVEGDLHYGHAQRLGTWWLTLPSLCCLDLSAYMVIPDIDVKAPALIPCLPQDDESVSVILPGPGTDTTFLRGKRYEFRRRQRHKA
ncbi:hypothetical protein PsYK624_043990 [Phanerochaete sordida]|uniref:F-box domain-containing protein n=1 Tax=Phanerochaete sordida TaxID=48140 RepID=A0A9P3LAE6_9APHY|nr:hypothetical protein PsYK624_043990 [Phanerochaete sordida]